MVEIVDPEQKVALGGSVVDSQAVTEDALASHADGSDYGVALPTTTGFQDGEPATTSAPPVSGSPDTQWESEGTRKTRQIGLIVAVSLISLLVCLAGFGWFVSSWSGQQQADNSVPGNSETNQNTVPSDLDTQPTLDSSDPENRFDHESGSANQPESSDETGSSGQPKGSEDQVENPAAESVSATENPQPEMRANPSVNPETRIPSDLIPVSPLESAAPTTDASQPGPDAAINPADTNEDATETSGMQELPPGLQQYTRFLLEEGPVEKPNLDAPPSMDDIELDSASKELDTPFMPVRPKVINLDADLAIQLAVDSKGYALPDLALIISQITGVPIQIDWVSFDLANLDLTTLLPPPKGWQPAKEILKSVCDQIGAEIRPEENLLTITLSDITFNKTLKLIGDLSDFGNDKISAAQVLSSFLESDPTDPEFLSSLNSRKEQQVALIAIEALRMMRGIPSKVPSEKMHRWAWPSDGKNRGWLSQIEGTSFPQADSPMSMAEFLRRISKQNQVQSLINWYDFSARNIYPDKRFLPHSAATSAETLQEVLEPLGLQARQVDANHWWFGRESTYDRLPAIIWTAPMTSNRETFVNQITNLVNQGANSGVFRLEVDPLSNRVLMVLPRYVAHQLPKLLNSSPEQTK